MFCHLSPPATATLTVRRQTRRPDGVCGSNSKTNLPNQKTETPIWKIFWGRGEKVLSFFVVGMGKTQIWKIYWPVQPAGAIDWKTECPRRPADLKHPPVSNMRQSKRQSLREVQTCDKTFSTATAKQINNQGHHNCTCKSPAGPLRQTKNNIWKILLVALREPPRQTIGNV